MMRSLLLLLALPSVALADAPRHLSLDEALRLARERQPQLRQARAQSDAADARLIQARAPLLPQLSGNASYQRTTANFVARPGTVPRATMEPRPPSFDTVDFFNFGLTLSQSIYDSGQTIGRFQAARATAEAQRQTEKATLLQVLTAVRTAYFNARAAKALVQVAHETLANQERHLRQIQGFVEVGTRPEIDLAQVRLDRANAQVQVINAENAYDVARAQLNQAIGVEGATDYEVGDEAMGPVAGEEQPAEALLEEALKARPEFAALVQQVRAQEATVRAARSGYAPGLSASTSITEAGTDLTDLRWNWNFGLTLNWQLFQGGQTWGQIKEAQAALRVLGGQQALLRQQVRLEIEQARVAVRAARATLEASGEALTNARQRLRLAEGRYQAGVGHIIELGDAQLALTAAAAQRVQAEYQLSAARAQLLRALGRM
jgi:outer membrane protein